MSMRENEPWYHSGPAPNGTVTSRHWPAAMPPGVERRRVREIAAAAVALVLETRREPVRVDRKVLRARGRRERERQHDDGTGSEHDAARHRCGRARSGRGSTRPP